MVFGKKTKDPFHEIQACLQRRDYKGALDWFNTLLAKDPKNTQIRLRFADTLVLAGSKKEAVKQYSVVARELARKGFMIRAIAINKKILQLDPSHTQVNETLAALSQERSVETPAGGPGKTTSLADVLRQPDAPRVRSTPPPRAEMDAEPPSVPEPAYAEASADKPEARPEPVVAQPEMSLEESMAMEFGSGGEELSAPPDPAAVEPPPPPIEEEATSMPRPVQEESPPRFNEESIDFGEASDGRREDEDEGEAAGVPALDAATVEESMEPEIVLDVVVPPEDAEAASGEPELEVVELDVETEPALAADGNQSLVGALGEDIDALIDSIIDDVGSSVRAGGAEPEEPAPTHIPLFSDLTSAEFVDVANLLVRKVVKAGDVVFRTGDPGDSMFIVSTGEVEAFVEKGGRRLVLGTLHDGDFFGELAVLSGEPRTATVTATRSTELLELDRKHLLAICSRHPHVEAKIRLAGDERMDRAPL